MNKNFLHMALAGVILFGLLFPSQIVNAVSLGEANIAPYEDAFSDVDYNNPYYLDIEELYDDGVIGGFEGKFYSLKEVTRSEMAKLVIVGTGLNEYMCEGSPHFTDVALEHPLYRYVETAYCLDIISGRGDGKFEADTPVLRQEAAKMILNGFRMADERQGTDYFSVYDTPPMIGTGIPMTMDDVESLGFEVNFSTSAYIPEGTTVEVTISGDGSAIQDMLGNLSAEALLNVYFDIKHDGEAINLSSEMEIRYLEEKMYMYLKDLEITVPEEIREEFEQSGIEDVLSNYLRNWILFDDGLPVGFGSDEDIMYSNSDSYVIPSIETENASRYYTEYVLQGEEEFDGVLVNRYSVLFNPQKYRHYMQYLSQMGKNRHFPDVAAESEFAGYIGDGSVVGLFVGLTEDYPETYEGDVFFGPGHEFIPDKIMTRGEAAVMINNARYLLHNGVAYDADTYENITESSGEVYIGIEDGYLYYIRQNATLLREDGIRMNNSIEFTVSDFNKSVNIEAPSRYMTLEEFTSSFMEEMDAFLEE